MGKYKGKNIQETNKNTESDSKPVNRDSFFLKSKIPKEPKHFQNQRMKNNKFDNSPSKNLSNTDPNEEKTKKPFDKKQWRIKKYSNKYKVDQWKEMRKKKILTQYRRFNKKDEKGVDVQKIYEQYDSENSDSDERNSVDAIDSKERTSSENVETNNESVISESRSPVKKGKTSKVHDKINQIKEEKLKKKEEILRKKVEREEALKLSRQKKTERYKRLNKKTKKGQPIMKDRMEMLYEQIKKIVQE